MEDGIYQKEEIVAALHENSLHLINWVAEQGLKPNNYDSSKILNIILTESIYCTTNNSP